MLADTPQAIPTITEGSWFPGGLKTIVGRESPPPMVDFLRIGRPLAGCIEILRQRGHS